MNPESCLIPTYNAGFQEQQEQFSSRQQRGHIKWNPSGISTSAGRRLPFVHRFQGLPPAGLPNDSDSPALPNENGSLPTKPKMSNYETNPVGALQERFQSRRLTPVFDLIQSEGASHCPIFTYKVTICDKTATGSGNSKKQAKHAAAKAMLHLLDGVEGQSVGASSNVGAATNQPEEPTVVTPSDDTEAIMAEQPGSNPIGELQEFCVKNGVPIPIYDLGSIDGQPHKRQFLMVAKVGAAESTGAGTSKKEAKKKAAAALLEKLTSAGTEGAKSIVFAGSPVSKNGIGSELEKEFSDLRVEPMSAKHSKVMQQFFRNLEAQPGKLHNLHHSSLINRNANYAATLMAISTELKFDVRFVEIEEATLDGECQCLCQLTTLPVAICYGVGMDNASAKNDAARNALYYLRIMTKKSNDELPSSAAATMPDPMKTAAAARSVSSKK